MFPYDKSGVKSGIEGERLFGRRNGRKMQDRGASPAAVGRITTAAARGGGRKEGRREVLDVCVRIVSRQIQFDKPRARNPVFVSVGEINPATSKASIVINIRGLCLCLSPFCKTIRKIFGGHNSSVIARTRYKFAVLEDRYEFLRQIRPLYIHIYAGTCRTCRVNNGCNFRVRYLVP